MLILHPTALSQWQALVNEAEHHSSIQLSEELESYLVFLLMRFSEQSDFVHSILGMEFLESLKKLKLARQESLRDVGDKCLLLAGLFPGNARRRRVRISYYVNLGQSAYDSLSETYLNQFSNLFASLSDHFVGLMDILHTLRELTSEQSVLDLLQAEELWQDTQSKHALSVLRKKTKGFFMVSAASREPWIPSSTDLDITKLWGSNDPKKWH